MNICVIGLGLLGGSFALGLKAKESDIKILGVDANLEHGKQALELGLADELLSLEQAVPKSKLVVLATPVSAITKLMPIVMDLLSPGGIVIDFGSTKELICKVADGHSKRKQFVACHPIAGTENSGPEAAFAGLLKRKTMIICDQQKSDAQALAFVEGICHDLEMRLSYMDSADHDLHLAYVSHLSHISSFALGITVLDKEKHKKNIFDMAGSGFSSTARLAKSSPQMWAPIFTQNKENISEALDSYIKQLQYFKEVIDNMDEEKSSDLMRKANDIRRILHQIDGK
jgi:prephenate dehydrogenase